MEKTTLIQSKEEIKRVRTIKIFPKNLVMNLVDLCNSVSRERILIKGGINNV